MSAPRRHSLLVLAICSLMPSGARGQQTPPPSPASPGSNLPPPNWIKLYSREQVITRPTLVESATSLQSECKGRKRDGKVAFSFIVDSAGLPRNVIFERALANEIDLLALNWLLNATFKPAMFQDAPVAMGQRVEMRLQACAEEKKDQSGKYSTDLRLRSPRKRNSRTGSIPLHRPTWLRFRCHPGYRPNKSRRATISHLRNS